MDEIQYDNEPRVREDTEGIPDLIYRWMIQDP
jgi:hypothetical protein